MQTGKYDLILMDIIMPILDGIAACTMIRRTHMTPVIAMTSNIRNADIHSYYSAGALPALRRVYCLPSH